MANKPDPNKRHISMRVPVETCRAIEKKYQQQNDASQSIAFIRALEDATRDVVLEPEDYQMIINEVRRNLQKRNDQ